MRNWLASHVKFSFFDDEDLPKMYYGNNTYNYYYTSNDPDLRNNDKLAIADINATVDLKLRLTYDQQLMKKYIDTHEFNQILLSPFKNIFYTNQLFKKMIDYVIAHKMEYNIYNTETDDYVKIPLMNAEMKINFYKFCYENS